MRRVIKGIGACTALVFAIGVASCDDQSPLGPPDDMTPTAEQAGVEEEASTPSLLVAAPGADQMNDPSAAAAVYCEDTKSIGGDCLFTNSTGAGYFLQLDLDTSSGTGVFDPFVRVSGNTIFIQGVNTSGRNLVWDENSSPNFTRDLRLDEVPQLECPTGDDSPWPPNETCREFALDTNEEGAGDAVFLSLDAVRVYVSPNENICDIDAPCKNGQNNPFDFDNRDTDFNLPNAELIYALDGIKETANGVGLDFTNDNGSGRADLVLYIHESEFGDYPGCNYDQGMGDDCDEFVHLYSHFGANDDQGDGFEEWDVRVLPIVLVSKTADVVADKRWTWTVDKTPDVTYNLFTGDQVVQEYDIDVDKVDYDLENFRVNGTITIENPDRRDAVLISNITDVFGVTTVPVTCPGVTIGAGGVIDPPYELAKRSSLVCTYGPIAVGDDFTTETNTAKVRLESGGQFEGSADANAADVTIDDEIDESVTLTDDVKTDLSEQFTDDGSTSYQWTFTCDDDEGDNINVATITGDDSGSDLDWDDATVTLVCHQLTVTKDAETEFTREYDWTITKVGDQTELTLQPDQTFLVNYEVEVDLDDPAFTDSDWAVSGDIEISNPNAFLAADLTDVSDVVSPDIAASVNCSGVTSVPASSSITCTYSADLPDDSDRTNTATATMQNKKFYWDARTPTNLSTTDYSGSADVVFGDPTTVLDYCIDVSDTNPNFPTPTTVCVDEAPKTFNYFELVGGTFSFPDDCNGRFEVPNTASFVEEDTGDTGSALWSVFITIECPVCTLTQGYWKTHNFSKGNVDGPPGPPSDPTWDLIVDPINGAGDETTLFFISGQSYFDVMWTSPGGNAYYIAGRQYIAATLNVLAESTLTPASVQTAYNFLTNLFTNYTPAQVDAFDNGDRQDVIHAAGILAGYNEGTLGGSPGHCDFDDGLTVFDDVPIS